MRLSKIDEYASQVPVEVKKAVKALGHDARCAIVVDLARRGELTFTQLKDDLDIDTGLLSNHLRILMDGAIVEHYYKHELWNEQYSYYGLTQFGKDFLRGILESLRAVQPPRYEFGRGEGGAVVGFSAPSRFLLIGRPGIGKTAQLKQILHAYPTVQKAGVAPAPLLNLPKRPDKKPMITA